HPDAPETGRLAHHTPAPASEPPRTSPDHPEPLRPRAPAPDFPPSSPPAPRRQTPRPNPPPAPTAPPGPPASPPPFPGRRRHPWPQRAGNRTMCKIWHQDEPPHRIRDNVPSSPLLNSRNRVNAPNIPIPQSHGLQCLVDSPAPSGPFHTDPATISSVNIDRLADYHRRRIVCTQEQQTNQR